MNQKRRQVNFIEGIQFCKVYAKAVLSLGEHKKYTLRGAVGTGCVRNTATNSLV